MAEPHTKSNDPELREAKSVRDEKWLHEVPPGDDAPLCKNEQCARYADRMFHRTSYQAGGTPGTDTVKDVYECPSCGEHTTWRAD